MFKCNYLWRTLHIDNNGSVIPCCYWEGDRTSSSLSNNQIIAKERQDALDGKVPTGCRQCVENEKYGSDIRQRSLRLYSEPPVYNTHIEPSDIEMLDIRIGNVCNFMCVICGDESSHLIAKESNAKNVYKTWSNDKYEEILNFLKESKNLKHILIAGGEPFYNKKKLLAILREMNHIKEHVLVQIITNGSVYDQEIMDELRKFNRTLINVSIDSVSRSNEIQRWNADNNALLSNLEKMMDDIQDDTHLFHINPAISNIVLPDIEELFVHFQNNPRIDAIHPNLIRYPDYLSINTVSVEYRKHIAERLKKHKFDKIQGADKFIDYIANMDSTSAHYSKIIKQFEIYKKMRGMQLPSEFYDILEK